MARKVQHRLDKDLTAAPANGGWEDLIVRAPKAEKAPAIVEARPEPPKPSLRQIAEEKERQLSSYMTHELRAPLTSIRSALGILEMQLDNRLGPEETQVLKMAMRNADRLSLLINDIMDFTKVQAGKLTMEVGPVRPEEILSEAVDSLRSWAVANGIRMTRVESDEPLPRVLADRKRMVQVVTNLLSNAIKFTPTGGKIEVSATLGGYDHMGTVLFRVKDSGPGIETSELDNIFKTFEQSALGVKTGKGTGLGLTLAKAMVELQGGRIWAESWKGLGASFLFTAPIFSGDTTTPVRPYPKKIRYHGIFVNLYKRLNAVVAALFT